MDELIVSSSQRLRTQLERQLQKLVRAVAVLGYCRHRGAVDAVGESVQEVEWALHQLQLSANLAEQSIDESSVIETHMLLDQARKLIGAQAMPRFADANVVEMRGNYSDLADAEFERMLAASDVAVLYANTKASENRCFGPEQANDDNAATDNTSTDNTSTDKLGKTKSQHLSLVPTSSVPTAGSTKPVSTSPSPESKS